MSEVKKARMRKEVIKIIKIMDDTGYETRIAGGAVRDHILGSSPKDFDLATKALPEKVTEIMTAHGFKVIPTGVDHGTVTVAGKHGAYELTSLRKDVETDGRRAVVSFGESFEEDSLRRDFSFNAMYEDAEGKLYDYHNGQEDLKNKRIRFVGDAETRIREDYLRIMRLFRFWARLDFKPDDKTLEIVAKTREGLNDISIERVRTELLLLLAAKHPEAALSAMHKLGVLALILPELSDADKIEAVSKLNTKKMTDTARLAFLLSGTRDMKFFKKLAKRLKLSQKEERALIFLNTKELATDMKQNEIMDLMDEADNKIMDGFVRDVAISYFEFCHPEKKELWDRFRDVDLNKNHIRKSPPLLNGDEILEIGKIEKGPLLGKLVKELKSMYRNELIFTKEEAKFFVKNSNTEKN